MSIPRTLKTVLPLLLFLLFAGLFASGCATKTQEAPATTQPISVNREITATTAIPPPVERQPVQTEASPIAPHAPVTVQTAPVAPPAPVVAPVPALTSVNQMLASAGRDASFSAQPEAEFFLRLPDVLGDGEAFSVQFGAAGAQKVDFRWRGRTLTVPTPEPGTGIFKALLPVPLDAKETSLPLSMTVHWADGRSERFSAALPVIKRSYPVQRLTVEPRFVTPPKDMEEKIKRDRAEMRAAVSTITAERHWTLPMLRPVPGEVTSQYGLRRVFNDQPRNPHRGLDLRAREGDPVHAADNGVVVLVSDHYFGGKTVVVDHGLGVLTAYLHLSAFNVVTGQKVQRGDVIGAIGSTGRVTAPHLHLSLYVMGESINPLPMLAGE